MHIIIVVLTYPLKIDWGKRISIFLVWMSSLKVVENRSFWHLCRCDARQNILAVYNVARQKIREYGGEKIDHFHWYHPLTFYLSVPIYYSFLLYDVTSNLWCLVPHDPSAGLVSKTLFLDPFLWSIFETALFRQNFAQVWSY